MVGQLLQCAFSSPDGNAPSRRSAVDAIGQRSSSSVVFDAASSSMAHMASCHATASISAGQQQNIGQPPMLLADGSAAVDIGAAAQSDQAGTNTASIDAAVTAGQQCVGSPSEQLVLQLHAAVQQRDGARVAALCSCPAAGQLSKTMVHELLLAAAGEVPATRLFLAAGEESEDGLARPWLQAGPAVANALADDGSHHQFTAPPNPVPYFSPRSLATPQQVATSGFVFDVSMSSAAMNRA
jgi:hypothetical protein